MVTTTSAAQSRAWSSRTAPAPEQILPGLWAIALGGDSPIAYTIDYLFDTGEGFAMVDTGWETATAYDGLVAALAALGRSLADLRTIVVTHIHPDHVGLVPRLLAEDPSRRLRVHDADLRLLDPRAEGARAEVHQRWLPLMETSGAPEELEVTRLINPGPAIGAELGPQIAPVEPGEVLELGPWRLEAVWTPGHTPGHLCFRVLGHELLLTGDHVLPRITPQVTLLSEPEGDPLGTYLSSLRAIRDAAPREVLPAHQFRFAGLAERVDEILAHHAHRLGLLEEAMTAEPGLDAWRLAHVLDWHQPLADMPPSQARMAAKETVVHLVHLAATGRARQDGAPPFGWSAA